MRRITDTLVEIIDIYTGELVTYNKVTTWEDGSIMDDSKCDGIIYRKLATEYFRRDFTGNIDVKWFGAVGNSSTDDTSSINQAISVASSLGIPLEISKGSYLIKGTTLSTTPINITTSVTLVGNIKSFFLEDQRHTVPLISVLGVRVEFRNITINGFETQADFDDINSTRYGIYLDNCDESILSNITISGKSRGIGINSSEDILVENLTYYGLFMSTPPGIPANYSNGVFINGGTRCKIINPVAYGTGSCVLVGNNSTYGQIIGGSVNVGYDSGVYISSGENWSIVGFMGVNPGGACVKTRGYGNTIRDCKSDGGVAAFSITGNGPLNVFGNNGYGNLISGCFIKNCTADGITLGFQDFGYAYGTLVEGCTFENVATDGGSFGAIRASGENHKFVNNEFINIQDPDNAIVLGDTVRHTVIQNNRFTSCRGGILGNNIEYCSIIGNDFINCGTRACIQLVSESTNNIIENNTTNDGFTGSSEITAPQSDTIINNNVISLYRTNTFSFGSEKNKCFDSNFYFSNPLPVADITHRGRLLYLRQNTTNDPDALYFCRRMIGFNYEWANIATFTPVSTVKTANYIALPTDTTIPVDSTANNVQITMPITGLVSGQTFTIKKISAANSVIIDPSGTVTIDGNNSYTLTELNQSLIVRWDGTNYISIANSGTSMGGIQSLNTLTGTSQTFDTGTIGTDFNISSSGSTHTFNIPSASATNRGLITPAAQTLGGNKTFNDNVFVNNLLGVGTTNPVNKFTAINPTAFTLSNYTTYTARIEQEDSRMVLGGDSTGSYIQTFNSLPLVLNGLGNNVGIGGVPTSKLSVTGAANVTGTFTIGTIGALATTGTTFLTHTAGLVQSRTATQVALDIGAVTLTTAQTISGQKTFTSPIVTQGVQASINFNNASAVQGASLYYNDGANELTLVATAASTDIILNHQNTILIENNSVVTNTIFGDGRISGADAVNNDEFVTLQQFDNNLPKSTYISTSLTSEQITATYMDTNYSTALVNDKIIFTNLSDAPTQILVVTRNNDLTWRVFIETKLT